MSSLTLRASALGLALALLAALAPGDDKKADGKAIDLKLGDQAPVFDLRDERGKTWSTSDAYGKKWVVTS